MFWYLAGMADSRSLSERLSKLPPGRHLVPRDFVAQNQRERMLLATAELVAERGYQKTTIELIAKTARVALSTFYEQFSSKEECFLAAFDAVRDHLEDLIRAAVAEEDDWPHQTIAALRAGLAFFAAEPDLARLCLLESVSATPRIAIRFREAVLACEPALALGRAELDDPDSMLPETEDAILGGIVSLATRSIIAGDAEKLPELLPDFADFALSPYLGAERAADLSRESLSA